MDKDTYFTILDSLTFVTDNFIDYKDPDVFLLHKFTLNLKCLYECLYKCYLSFRQDGYIFIEDDDITDNEFNNIMHKVRKDLWYKLIENYDFVYEPINCYKSGQKIRITDLCFLCITLCNICTSYKVINEKYTELAPSDIPYARKSRIVKTETPIMEMSVFELVDSLHQLSYNWNKLYYDKELIKYIDLLEFRTSIILNETNNSNVFDVEGYRKEINKKYDIYAYNTVFLNVVSSYLIGFKIRTANYLVSEHVECPNKYAPEEWKCTNLLNWLKKSAKSSFGDFIYVQFRMKYLKLIIRPGEREEYIRKRPSDVITEQKIYRCVRGDEAANKILEFSSNREAYDMLDDDEVEYANSRPTMAYILLDKVFGGIFDVPLGRYVIFRDEIRYRHMELQYEENPIIIQSFNRFNVYYKGQIYILNDFIKSFVTFLNIIEQEQGAAIENGQLDAKFLYTNFFHKNYFAGNSLNISQSKQSNNLNSDDEEEYHLDDIDNMEDSSENNISRAYDTDNNNNIFDDIEIIL